MEAWTRIDVPRIAGEPPPLRVYDTARRELAPVAPGKRASMYVCGITPYDATHLGHAATYVTFDVLHRTWLDEGRQVSYVQNVTDIDDPLLERATATGEDWRVLAEREVALYREDMAALRVLPPTSYVGAVEAIPRIVELIEQLQARGAAYELNGDIYFSVASDRRFGEVAHLDAATMLALSAERGGDPERPGKKDPLDCLLWQRERPGEPAWESALGPGRPGWHVECVAIALAELGHPIDVQGGGHDLAFPHHELGAAQATVATGDWPFARLFMHSAMVGLDGEKMSKSRGNLVFVSALRRDGVDPIAIRLALLAHHYRNDWTWSSDDLQRADERLTSWREAVRRDHGPAADDLRAAVRRNLADDLDVPSALSAIDRWARDARNGYGEDTAGPHDVRELVDALLGVQL